MRKLLPMLIAMFCIGGPIGCWKPTTDPIEEAEPKIGFRPYYIGDVRVFRDSQWNAAGSKEWFVKVVAEDTLGPPDSIRVAFSVADSGLESVTMKSDTLKKGYVKLWTSSTLYCDMYAWYPESGEWGSGESFKFHSGNRSFNVKIVQCSRINIGGPTTGGSRKVVSYIDSALGIIYKKGEFSAPMASGECGSQYCSNEIRLISFNGVSIDPFLVKRIADSLNLEKAP